MDGLDYPIDNSNTSYYYEDFEFDDNLDDEGESGSAEILGIVLGTVFGIVSLSWFCVMAHRRNWWFVVHDINAEDPRPVCVIGASSARSVVEAHAQYSEAIVSPLYVQTEATVSRDDVTPEASVEVELSPVARLSVHPEDQHAPEATEIPVASAI